MPRITSISSMSIREEGKKFVFVQRALASSPGQMYEWNNQSGWGERTDITYAGGAGQTYQGCAVHPSGSVIAVGGASSAVVGNYLYALQFSRAGYSTTGQQLTSASQSIASLRFSPNGKALAAGFSTATSPYMVVYPYNTSDGFGAKYTDPATLLASFPRGVSFSPTGASLIVANISTPNIHGYPWTDASGFGTKFSNPATSVTGTPLVSHSMDTIMFPDGTMVVVIATNTTPYLNAYPFTDTGFGTKFTAPTALFAGISNRPIRFLYNGTTMYIIVGPATTPFLAAMDITTTAFGTKLADPGTAFSGTPYGIDISNDKQTVFVKTSTNSPSVAAYKFTNSWGTKYADPAAPFSSTTTDSTIGFIKTP
jgi:hypothetical protein